MYEMYVKKRFRAILGWQLIWNYKIFMFLEQFFKFVM